MIAWTFRVAWAGETFPPTAVTATTSNSGSDKRQTQGHRVVDARINVEDYFSGHWCVRILRWRETLERLGDCM